MTASTRPERPGTAGDSPRRRAGLRSFTVAVAALALTLAAALVLLVQHGSVNGWGTLVLALEAGLAVILVCGIFVVACGEWTSRRTVAAKDALEQQVSSMAERASERENYIRDLSDEVEILRAEMIPKRDALIASAVREEALRGEAALASALAAHTAAAAEAERAHEAALAHVERANTAQQEAARREAEALTRTVEDLMAEHEQALDTLARQHEAEQAAQRREHEADLAAAAADHAQDLADMERAHDEDSARQREQFEAALTASAARVTDLRDALATLRESTAREVEHHLTRANAAREEERLRARLVVEAVLDGRMGFEPDAVIEETLPARTLAALDRLGPIPPRRSTPPSSPERATEPAPAEDETPTKRRGMFRR